jgi:hypothetical protein
MAAMAVGGMLHGPTSSSVTFWMVAMYFGITLGLCLVVGQALVYRVYRERVVAAR